MLELKLRTIVGERESTEVVLGIELRTKSGGREITTVDISPPLNYFGTSPSPYYETIVLGVRDRKKIASLNRYNTIEEAQEGHAQTVNDVMANPSIYYRARHLF